MEAGVRDFVSAEAAEASPLAAALFATGRSKACSSAAISSRSPRRPAVELERSRARRARGSARPFRQRRALVHARAPPPASTSTRAVDSPKTRPTPTSSTRSRISSKPASARRSRRTAATSSIAAIRRRHALSRHAWRVQRLPVVGNDPEARDRRPHPRTMFPRSRPSKRSSLTGTYTIRLPAALTCVQIPN